MNLLANPLLLRKFVSCRSAYQRNVFSSFITQPRAMFSYLQQQAMRFQQIDAQKDKSQPDSLVLQVPYAAQDFEVKIQRNQSLSTFANSVKSLSTNIKSVDFLTLDGAIIPQCELLCYRENIPFVMILKSADREEKYSYAVNLNESYSIIHDHEEGDRQSEEAYLSYCAGIGLPKYTSFLLANFANKLHHALPHSEVVKNEDIIKGMYQTIGYYRSVGSDKSELKVSDIERIIDQKQAQLIKLNEFRKVLDRKADRRARALLFLGSSIFIAQFGFIMGGTFVYYSWDVMEPISYTMMLANFVVGFLFYTSAKKEMALGNLREMLAARSSRRLYRKNGLDIEKLEQLENEIIELRKILNKSIF